MATLNTERLGEMPVAIDEAKQTYGVDMPNAAETIKDLAKQTGSGQFIKDAEKFAECVDKIRTMVLNALGEEGDTMTENGTVYSAYGAAKKIEKAMGGEL